MNLPINPLVIGWALLANIVLTLRVLKTRLEHHEDSNIHLDAAETGMVVQQSRMARKLDLIEFWGKLLTVAALPWGLTIAAAYFYSVRETGNAVINQYH